MIYLKILAGVVLLGSLAWLMVSPDFTSVLAVIGAVVAFLALFVAEAQKKKSIRQNQSVSNSSFGIQAGGDVNIGTPRRDDHVE
jgi:hypothetical protein